jgi:hypothetical protein
MAVDVCVQDARKPIPPTEMRAEQTLRMTLRRAAHAGLLRIH